MIKMNEEAEWLLRGCVCGGDALLCQLVSLLIFFVISAIGLM